MASFFTFTPEVVPFVQFSGTIADFKTAINTDLTGSIEVFTPSDAPDDAIVIYGWQALRVHPGQWVCFRYGAFEVHADYEMHGYGCTFTPFTPPTP